VGTAAGAGAGVVEAEEITGAGEDTADRIRPSSSRVLYIIFLTTSSPRSRASAEPSAQRSVQFASTSTAGASTTATSSTTAGASTTAAAGAASGLLAFPISESNAGILAPPFLATGPS